MVAAPPVGFNLTFVCPDGQVIVHHSVRLDLLLIRSIPDYLTANSHLLNMMTTVLRIRGAFLTLKMLEMNSFS